MLDKVTVYILNVILSECSTTSEYVVFEIDEVIKNSPLTLNLTQEKLFDSVKSLSRLGYVNLRHLSSDAFCLSVTDIGKNYISDVKVKQKKQASFYRKAFFLCLLGGFLGAILGGLVARCLG